jgi:hypothetical protein
MKILFDQGVPLPLRKFFKTDLVKTAFEMGWSELKNGDLIQQAESQFDLFVTNDKNLRYQQNLTTRRIAIALLPTTQWPVLLASADFIVQQLALVESGDFIELQLSTRK